MAKIPVIGITANTIKSKDNPSPQVVLSQTYIDAVTRAGGSAVVLPSTLAGDALEKVFSRLDGILLSGGSDIDPARFDGVPHHRVYGIDMARDELEMRIVSLAVRHDKPFMGICRGIQSINVALGGSLYTDIGDQLTGSLRHDYYPDLPRDYLAHPVSVESSSRLASILGGQNFEVNSLHHQGIQRLAPGLHAVAVAPDGLVEAVELPGHVFGMAVQWHPECLQEYQPQRALFDALISASARR